MELTAFIQTVENSSSDQWLKMQVQTVYGWEHGQAKGQNYLAPKTFDTLAVLKGNIDISMVMTATVNEPFDESWVRMFPDRQAKSVAVFLRYRGAVVYEWVGVLVDGGRYLLPMPDTDGQGGYQVPHPAMTLARLIFDIYAPHGVHGQIEAGLQRAGVSIV